jgi:4-amino-4-deoxy-L-arabinose transferase-like glycosyltransferase
MTTGDSTFKTLRTDVAEIEAQVAGASSLRTDLRWLVEGRVVTRVLLALAFGLGAVLRIVNLNAIGFNSDEAVYAGQAAALAGDPTLQEIFPIFRAHPMLFHVALSLAYGFGVSDFAGRLVTVAFGLTTLWIVYRCGAVLYSRRAGALAALLLAVMPYHVMVSRQVLLDAPMTLFASLTLLCVASYAATGRQAWLLASGAALGLTVLTKETGVLFFGALYAFFALSPEVKVKMRQLAAPVAVAGALIAAFPLTLMLAGGGGRSTGTQYLTWQLLRRPNHDWSFYLETTPPVVGMLLLGTVLVGLWIRWRSIDWRERLLLCWLLVPVGFFQLWPVKGFQYLLPVAPALALLAARVLIGRECPAEARTVWSRLRPVLGVAVVLQLIIAAAGFTNMVGNGEIRPVAGGRFLAGAGGVPGGREAGEWIRQYAPEGATLMTIGPSMANIVQFYGHRRALGLSVSSNPLHRNPSYEPIGNADRRLRDGEIQYIVWDTYSASRSSFFSDKLARYIDKYHGRRVYPAQERVSAAPIVIYEVRP